MLPLPILQQWGYGWLTGLYLGQRGGKGICSTLLPELFGLPISIIIMYFIHVSTRETFEYGFALPWMDILYVVIAIFVIVSPAMLYSISKIRKENIIEGLKQENI